MKKIRFLLVIIFCYILSFAVYEKASLALSVNNTPGNNVIDVGAPGIKKIKISIPSFISNDGGVSLGSKDITSLSNRMTSILDFTNWFEFVANSSASEYIISGKIAGVKNSKPDSPVFNLELSLLDVKLQSTVTGKTYTDLDLKSADLALRKFADAIVKSLTGTPGPFLSQIVFIGKKASKETGQVYVADFDGGNLQQITHNKSINMSPSWASDGKKITYTSFESGKPEIYMYNLSAQKTTKITDSGNNNSGANWSPDGGTIAYSASTTEGETHIFTMNKNGGHVKSFIAESEIEVEPAFSPDGKYLAYTSSKFKKPMIFVRDLNSDTTTRLTYAGWYNASASWTPDSKAIVFASYDRDIDKWDLFKIKSDGSDLERLTLSQGDNEKPTWSPDGRFILFQSDRTSGGSRMGHRKLYVMTQDGANQKALNIPLAEVKQAYWGPRME